MHLASVGFWVSNAESGLLPIAPQRPILLLLACPDVMKGDDSNTGLCYTDGLAHRSMLVSAVAATFKSP